MRAKRFRASVTVTLAAALTAGLLLSSVTASSATNETTTTSSLKSTTSTTSTTQQTSSTTTTIRSETSTYLNRSTPGVYVSEIAGFGNQMVQVAVGVPLIVGVGPAVGGPPIGVSSFEEFTTRVSSSSTSLRNAVQQFFGNGGQHAFIAGSADTSAGSITSAFSAPIPEAVDLLVSADMNALPASEWLGVAVAMGRAALPIHAIALVDPPQSVVAAAQASPTAFGSLTALGSDLHAASGPDANSIFLFASGVVAAGGELLPTSPFMAGLIAATAQSDGVWTPATGFGNTIAGVQPQFATSNSQDALLQASGLVPLSYMPGRGTVVVSDRMLSGPDDLLQNELTLNTIQQTVIAGLQPYVFAANDATTWQSVTQAASGYLTALFASGGLQGPTAADAFTVSCGLGTTMTSVDILNGILVLSIAVAIDHPGAFDQLSFTQVIGN
jgi:hypothetical protein